MSATWTSNRRTHHLYVEVTLVSGLKIWKFMKKKIKTLEEKSKSVLYTKNDALSDKTMHYYKNTNFCNHDHLKLNEM